MKKIISIILIFVLIGFNLTVVFAQRMAVKSDIRTYIDYTPIRSYNIDGYTYVIAEELRNYGFEVVWSNEARNLKIYRKNLKTPVYTKGLFDAETDSVNTTYIIYDTDIKTYLNGELANSFNIGGQTVIQIDELSKCGKFEWDYENREVRGMIFETELQNLYAQAENKAEIIIRNEPKSTYVGQVNEEGKPNGIGCLTEQFITADAGVSYSKTDKILGYFSDGQPDGVIFLDRYIMSGKTGGSLSIKYVGETDSSLKAERKFVMDENSYPNGENIRGANMGDVALPHYFMKNYVNQEVFADARVYTNGVWFENDGYRGQKGVTFRSWYACGNYQSILKTNLDENKQPIVIFEETNQVGVTE